MVIDTSALIAILLGESEAQALIELIASAADPVLSAATLLEASIVMHSKTGQPGLDDLDEMIAAAAIRTVAVDATQAQLARQAFLAFGKGHAQAALNYGDCFSYALAKALDRPLLFKGHDFAQTDIEAASA